MIKELDWDFVAEGGDMLEACEKAASRCAREWGVEYEDFYQEAVIWLAVHTEAQSRFLSGEYNSVAHLAQQIYANGLRDLAIRDSYGGMTNLPHDKNDHVIPIAEGVKFSLAELDPDYV